ncbi:MAG: Ig-like domain-containing protein [Desulfuromonadales bacterium]
MKKIAYLSILLSLLFLFSACGGGGGDDPFPDVDPGGGGGGGDVSTSEVESVTITSPNESLVANGSDANTSASAGVIRVVVTDTEGSRMVGQAVAVSTTAGAFSPSAGVTDDSGIFQTTLTAPALLGSVTVSAVAGGVQSNQVTINIVQGPPANITVHPAVNATTGDPSVTVTPGGATEVTAIITDANNFPVKSGTSVSATVSDNKSKVINPFLGFTTTDDNGQAKWVYTAGGTEGTDTITVSAGQKTATTKVGVSAEATISQVATVALTSLNTTLVASGSDRANPQSSKGSLLVLVKDTDGQPLATQAVTFYASGGTISGDATTNITNSNGELQVTLTAPPTLGSITVYATAGSVRSENATIEIVQGPAKNIDAYASPKTVGPGGSAEILAIVTDDNGFPVTSGTSIQGVITDNLSEAIIPFLGFTPTDTNGLAKLTYTAGTKTPATDTITLTAGNAEPGTVAVQVSQGEGVFKSFTLATSRDTIAAGGTETARITATALDSNDAGIAGVPVTFSTTAGTLLDSEDAAIAGSVPTEPNGVATVYLKSGNYIGQTKVTASTTSGYYDLVFVNFEPGPVFEVVLRATPDKIKPEGNATLTATVKDENQNPIAGETVYFTVETNNSGGTVTANAVTNGQGEAVAIFTGGAVTKDTTVTVKARTSNTKYGTEAITVSPNAQVIKSVTLTAGSSQIIADDKSQVALRAQVLDTDNRGIAGLGVDFATTLGKFIDAVGEGTTATAVGETDGLGVAQVFLQAGKAAGQAVVSAEVGGHFDDIAITLSPGPVRSIKMLGSPSEIAPGGESAISAVALDEYGNPVVGASLTFLLKPEDMGTITPNPAITDVNGRAVAIYTGGPISGTFEVNARAQNSMESEKAASIEIVSSKAVSALTATADRQVLAVDPLAEITVLAFDNQGAPVEGAEISISTTGKGPTLHPADPEGRRTDTDGQYVFTVSDSEKENVAVTVRAGGKSQVVNLYFGATLFLLPGEATAIGSQPLTALLKDAGGRPLPGQRVEFSFVDGGNETLSPATGVTGADGSLLTTVVDVANNGGDATVTAVVGSVESDPAKIHFALETASNLLDARATFQVLPADGVAETTLVATVTDDQGIPLADIPVYFGVDGSAELVLLDPLVGVKTDANGQATAKVKDAVAENVIATISLGGANFIEIPLYFGATVLLDPDESDGIGNGANAMFLKAIVRDALGAAVPGVPVDFKVVKLDPADPDEPEALLAQSRAFTATNGQAVNSITGTAVEDVKVEAMAGLVGPATATAHFLPGEPGAITLTSTPPAPVSLSIYGTATITAKVKDAVGNPVADNTPVQFATNLGGIPGEKLTKDGEVTVEFSALETSGTAQVTATAGNVTANIIISIAPSAEVGTIMTESVEPTNRTIHIAGTEGNRVATIRFLVRDSAGNPVADGTPVVVYFDPTRIGGGEALSAGGAYTQSVATPTTNGIATVSLRSGTVAGDIDVVAAYDPDKNSDPTTFDGNEIATITRITMVGGLPDAEHFGLRASTLNLAGGLYSPLPSTITATLGDRFGNVVLDGTQVSFISECGTIGESTGFTATTQQGDATAVFRTASPMLSGTNLLNGPDGGGFSIRNGLCRIVAYTQGSESYEDLNGNGIFDAGDNCVGDLPEPFIDENDSGGWEPGELYIDVNNNGRHDSGDLLCQENTMIWTSMNLLMTGGIGPLNLRKDSLKPKDGLDFTLAVGESQTFLVDFQDAFIQDLNDNGDNSDIGFDYGNIPVAGTSLLIEKDGGGKLLGTTSHVQADSNGTGGSFPFTVMSDIEEDAEPEVVEITVMIQSSDAMLTDPVSGLSTGNNNGATVIQKFAGIINMPPPSPAPIVVVTSPTDGQTGVDTKTKVIIAFNNVMDGLTVTPTNVTMDTSGASHALVGATDIKDQKVYEFTPGPELAAGTEYTVTVSGNAVLDEDGAVLGTDYTFTFTTAP